jgi:hypothetical protein
MKTMRRTGPPRSAMNLPLALIADLQDLAIDLAVDSYSQTTLEMLQRDLRRNVATALGASITVPGTRMREAALQLNLVRQTVERHEIATGLKLSLNRFCTSTAGVITFYATAPQAFVQLATDLASVLQLSPGDLDQHPPLPVEPLHPGISGLQDLAVVNQAVGILMGRGRSLHQARAELRHRAVESGTGLREAACTVRDSYC